MLSSISGLHPLVTSSIFQLWQPKMSPDITKCSLREGGGGKNDSLCHWEPLSYKSFKISFVIFILGYLMLLMLLQVVLHFIFNLPIICSRWANFNCKWLDDLCYNYTTLPLQCKSSHRQHVNKWVRLHCNKTICKKQEAGGIWSTGHSLPTCLFYNTKIQLSFVYLPCIPLLC